jgi:hypothetical protein
MFRASVFAAVGLLASLALTTAAAAEGATLTRIEPRPFYGATVTLEAGVRVFRTLPPHKHVIINPDHRTPLNVTVKDIRETRTIKGEFTHNYYNRGGYDGGYVTGFPVGAYGLGHRDKGFRDGHRARGFPGHVRRAPKYRRHGGGQNSFGGGKH